MTEIALLAGANAAYAMPLAVTLSSALRHLDPDCAVDLYILDGGLGAENIVRLKDVLPRAHAHVTITVAAPDPVRFAGLNQDRYSIAGFYRLLAHEIVEPRHDRVLYLDSDIVLQGSVAPLWDITLGDHPVWAVQNFSQRGLHAAIPDYSDPDHALYFNSGVLLMNLARWRDLKISDQVIAFLQENSHDLLFPDQDAMNGVLKGDWGRLSPIWNAQMNNLKFVTSLRRVDGAPETEAALKDQMRILHYTAGKPWKTEFSGSHWADFLRAYLASGWDSPPRAWGFTAQYSLRQILQRVRRKLSRSGSAKG